MYIFIYIHIHIYRYTVHPIGWRRCIGCLKLQVSFHKKASYEKARLWKMTYTDKDKVSFSSLPPCTIIRGSFVERDLQLKNSYASSPPCTSLEHYAAMRCTPHKRTTKNMALLRKMTYIDKASYSSSPPCTSHEHCVAMRCTPHSLWG